MADAAPVPAETAASLAGPAENTESRSASHNGENLRERIVALEAELMRMRASHADEIERIRISDRGEFAEALEATLAACSERLVGVVGDKVAAVLVPFLSVQLARRSIEALGERLRALAVPGAGLRLRLCGNRALFEAVSGRLSAHDWAFEFVEADDVDLVAEVDSVLIETRLGEWATQIDSGN